jgi:NAD(P)-dependent dehydrogenase (short-subunit alcohol dehydrogenase family)
MHTLVITGADRGLGFALTCRCLEGGDRVVAGSFQGDSELAPLAEQYPDRLRVVRLDVTDMAQVRAAATLVSAQVGAVDVLVNNAGVYLEDRRSVEEADLGDGQLERTMNVNAFGPFRVTTAFLPLLERGRARRIVNISSEAGSIADSNRKNEIGYCMSKAALNMQTKILHNALAARGYRITAVHPGWMRTAMGGPEADISPEEAASGIYALSISPDPTPLYVDYRGNLMRW